jgi:hypothetical protein
MAQLGLNGRSGDVRRRVLERLAAIKIHAGSLRRAARRPEPVDKRAMIEQLDQIDLQVAQATQLLDGNPSTMP